MQFLPYSGVRFAQHLAQSEIALDCTRGASYEMLSPDIWETSEVDMQGVSREIGGEGFFKEIYKSQIDYHHQKKQLVWLAAYAYLVSIGVATGWLPMHLDLWVKARSSL